MATNKGRTTSKNKDSELTAAYTDSYAKLKELSQQLCDEDNYIDAIAIIDTEAEFKDVVIVNTETKIQEHEVETITSYSVDVLQLGEKLKKDQNTSTNQLGDIETMLYVYENLAYVIYKLDLEENHKLYLILINSEKADLRGFNLNRPRVFNQVYTAYIESGLQEYIRG